MYTSLCIEWDVHVPVLRLNAVDLTMTSGVTPKAYKRTEWGGTELFRRVRGDGCVASSLQQVPGGGGSELYRRVAVDEWLLDPGQGLDRRSAADTRS